MKRLFLIPLLVATALVSSCEKAVEPDVPADECTLENSLKLQTGNWWVYETWQLDANNNKIAGSDKIDSVVVDGTELRYGKTAYRVVTYTTADNGITWTQSTKYWAVEDGRLYALASDIIPLYCECLGQPWLLMADCSREQWPILDSVAETSLPAVVDNELKTTLVRHDFDVHGSRLALETVSAGSTTVQAHPYVFHSGIAEDIIEPVDATFIDGGRHRAMQFQIRLWLADNIGIAQMSRTVVVVTSGAGSQQTVAEPGGFRKLLRWSVR